MIWLLFATVIWRIARQGWALKKKKKKMGAIHPKLFYQKHLIRALTVDHYIHQNILVVNYHKISGLTCSMFKLKKLSVIRLHRCPGWRNMEHGQRELWATEVSMWVWVQWRALFFFLYNDTLWQCCFKWFHNFLEMPLVKFLTEDLITYSRRWKRQYFGPVKMVLCLFWSQMQSYAASLWSAFFLGLMSYSCVKYCVVFMANPNIVRCLAAKMKEPVLCWRWQGKKWALFCVRVPESRAILRMPCNNDHSNSSVRIYGAKVWRENHLRIKLDQTFILITKVGRYYTVVYSY